MEKKRNKEIMMPKKWIEVIGFALVGVGTLCAPTSGWLPFLIALLFKIILTALPQDEPNKTDKTA
ncbi:hypothetical protein IQ270_16130 [Microcoleus sp. LEGE 07076]|uniref:hypothetical protein n=1 Tax=Microcoleus sp. LEGE 07076 TaxID=915322 RepID=UPI00187ECD29|nr:hypothetical protein [Microcoleus sp. LEGE 07076]MBE9186171.1 hypothetical protein [Microcoleus sp. LEGE 07076]